VLQTMEDSDSALGACSFHYDVSLDQKRKNNGPELITLNSPDPWNCKLHASTSYTIPSQKYNLLTHPKYSSLTMEYSCLTISMG